MLRNAGRIGNVLLMLLLIATGIGCDMMLLKPCPQVEPAPLKEPKWEMAYVFRLYAKDYHLSHQASFAGKNEWFALRMLPKAFHPYHEPKGTIRDSR